MLHILLFILKIIGWTLLGVLALVLVVSAGILLCAFRYEGALRFQEELSSLHLRIRFRWLFGLLRGRLVYKEGRLQGEIRLFWKHLPLGSPPAAASPNANAERGENTSFSRKEDAASRTQEASDALPLGESSEAADSGEAPRGMPRKPAKEASKTEKTSSQSAGKQSLSGRIRGMFDKMAYTFRRVYGKIKGILDKKNRIQAFLEDETHRRAFQRAGRALKGLLKALHPREWKVHLLFGLEDPYNTGRVLAYAAPLYPLFEGNLRLTPDFEEKRFRGKAFIKGHIRLASLLVLALRLLLCKEVRSTYRDGKALLS